MALLAAEHEEVGEHLLVLLLRNPFNVEQLHLANACELERLVGVALYLVTPYVEAVVHEEKRFHNAVAHRLTLGRRVVAQHAHTPAVHGLFQHLRVAVDGIDTPKFAFLETVIVVLQKIKLCKGQTWCYIRNFLYLHDIFLKLFPPILPVKGRSGDFM